MNTFKRKALFTAVPAGLGALGTAEAVYLNPNGTGQALVNVNGRNLNSQIDVRVRRGHTSAANDSYIVCVA